MNGRAGLSGRMALRVAVVAAVVSLACASTVVHTRRVIVPIDADGGRCYGECTASSFCTPGRPCYPAQYACLGTCRNARVEPGPCAGAELRPNERCWTNTGAF